MKRRIGLPVLSALTLLACSPTEQQEVQNEAMSFTAKVEGSDTNRAVTIGVNYAMPLSVAFARLDQNPFTGLYTKDYVDINTSLFATRSGGSEAVGIHFDVPQFYQSATGNNDTRLVGWFPAVTPVAGALAFDISDGATDVLLTQELVGNAESKIGTDDNPFLFRRQLCQVVVSVVATSPETVERWGTVDCVKVKNLPTSYVVILPGGTQAVGSADLMLNLRGGDRKMAPVALSSTRFAECGYLLTAPTDNTLTLELTGGNGETLLFEAPLPDDESFKSGRSYHLRVNLDGQHAAGFSFSYTMPWEDDVNLDVAF